MKLVVGLGNPGKQYENTRHNAGFIVLDEIVKIFSFSEFQFNKKFNAEIIEGIFNGEKIILAKPQSFMNLSGQSIQSIMKFFKIPIENLRVIHDDLDIELGNFKISTDSSSAGHNGAASIFETFGTQKIARIRVGIEGAEKKRDRKIPGDVFVLQPFLTEDLETIKKLSQDISKNI